MFQEYGRTKRIRVPEFNIPGKTYLSDKEVRALLTGRVIIEEKIDGANTGIIRVGKEPGFALQKRRSLVGHSEHAQYNYFSSWAYSSLEKVLKLPVGTIVYGELMYAKHNIFYDRLPGYFICFDILDKKSGEFCDREQKEDYCRFAGIPIISLVWEGSNPQKHHLPGLIPRRSAYSSDRRAEGIVIKNYRKQARGKLVHPTFLKEIDEGKHWMTAPITRNLLSTEEAQT